MAADKDNGKNLFGRPRRSSFVAASEENADFVPILPAVGSTPIPAASDVNYFPTVATGQPSLREPSPPARLVVPTRKSLSEEEIATIFVESADMSSSEQISMLDAQVTLRDDDLRTAKEFVGFLRSAKPDEAASLLDELKRTYADVDPQIATLTLGGDTTPVPSGNSDVHELFGESVSPQESPSSVSPRGSEQAAESRPAAVSAAQNSVNGRYRGWSAAILVATLFAVLIPVTSAVFTPFGSPAPDSVDSLLSASGVVVAVVALVTSLPLLLLARSTAVRHALSTRTALQRVAGRVGGTILWILGASVTLVGLVTVLLVTTQGVGLQISSIPGVTSTLAQFAPQAHVSVFIVVLVLFAGFVIASLPRAAFRSLILALTGFSLVGPAVVILTGLAVVATTNTGIVLSPENLVIATGIIPISVILLAGVESGTATVVRRDEKPIIGVWLYIGLAAGAGFAAWFLVAGISPDASGNVLVGSNPALHIVASGGGLAFLLGAIAFVAPLTLVVALIGRSLVMATVSDDRQGGSWITRILLLIVPAVIIAIDVTGLAGDITTLLPGIPFVSIPLMVIVGIMAGASVASRRKIAGGARVVHSVIGVLLVLVGCALTSWSVPGLANTYTSVIAPLSEPLGLSGTVSLVVPAAVLVISFVLSLVVSMVGVVRPNRTS